MTISKIELLTLSAPSYTELMSNIQVYLNKYNSLMEHWSLYPDSILFAQNQYWATLFRPEQ